ncbi:organic anion transporter, partial [Aphelenchoides avenae]
LLRARHPVDSRADHRHHSRPGPLRLDLRRLLHQATPGPVLRRARQLHALPEQAPRGSVPGVQRSGA